MSTVFRTFLVVFSLVSGVCGTERLRGIAISKLSFYDPSRLFTCLDGSATIDFDSVNDDYCDCEDGTDEPGTPACSRGQFHCTNAGHRPQYIPSSRVNDGICDCCDTTDEYSGLVQCTNNCKDLGAVEREERRREREKQQQGYEMRLEYSQTGKEKKQDRQTMVEELKTELDKIRQEAEKLEEIKKTAEGQADAAKQEHIDKWKAEQEAIEKKKADEAFTQLDTDSDGMLVLSEFQSKTEFDSNGDGTVDAEEILEFTKNNTQVEYDSFYPDIWNEIKRVFPPPAPQETDNVPPTDTPPADIEDAQPPETPSEEPEEEKGDENKRDEIDNADESEHGDDDDDDEDDDDEDDDEEYNDNGGEEKPVESPELEGMPSFSDETQALIDAASKAAEEHGKVDQEKSEKERELRDVENELSVDLGPDEEFFPLQGHCYEYTEREYTYKLCPFDKVSQRSKHGGSETSLGSWGKWNGESNKYDGMLYDNGEKCWNGPARSASISIKCGITNELVSSSEPNRCEYAMVFHTPAACRHLEHDEL
ncbi:glucosidase 2 subunit beta-like [Oscarella lobularis]|uniref:glucosidase 2 subunit beta-like n=1 Tax=Oscarella lobularis TaxID=121494 RepID=UPI0033138391